MRWVLLIGAVFVALGSMSVCAQVRLSSEEAEKLVVDKPEPPYPAIAKAARAQGIVRVEIKVSEEGKVVSTRVLSGHPLLQASAAIAAKERTYKPYVVDEKATAFITIVDMFFSLDDSTKHSSKEVENDVEVGKKFFSEESKCRELLRSKTWKEAEIVCGAVVRLADQFGSGRELEKMGAYVLFGHALMGQERFKDALAYYVRAHEIVTPRLKETDAELAEIYGHIAIAYHAMLDLNRAREFYRKAEKTFQLAHANIGKDGPDEHSQWLQQKYAKALKRLLEFHLAAAEDAGDAADAEEVGKLLKSLPQ